MFNGAQTNPIFARTIRQGRWPSLWETVLLFVLILMIEFGLIFALIHREISLQILPSSSQIMIVMGIYMMVFLVMFPMVVGIITAITTSADVQSEGFTLVSITELDAGQIAQGYLLRSLYRLRTGWAGLLASVPAMILTAAYSYVLINQLFLCYYPFYSVAVPSSCSPLTKLVFQSTIFQQGVALGVVFSILGASLAIFVVPLGLWSGIRMKSLAAAVTSTIGIYLLVLIGVVLPTFYFIIVTPIILLLLSASFYRAALGAVRRDEASQTSLS